MTWFKADDRLPDHRKVRQLGRDRLASMGLWLLSGCWSAGGLTDGFVPAEVATRYHPQDTAVRQAAEGLVRVGLWVPETLENEAGHRFHDWAEWQPTREQVETERDAAKERQRRSRQRTRGDARGSHTSSSRDETRDETEVSRVTHAEVPDPVPARPGPSRPGPSDVPGGTSGGERVGERPRPVASASGGPPPLPSEVENDEPTGWPAQPCGRPHDPDQPCGRCGRARRTERDTADQAVLAEASRRAAEARRREQCPACDANGWLEHPDSGTPVVRCDHETDARKQLADALDHAS